mmetsp:Transcript_10360/g.26378  ORF Transcript_10360/g.26378 Transcript_10360/m.26378 type:complete len:284 (-) Transcript_10360:2389-3240(-)
MWATGANFIVVVVATEHKVDIWGLVSEQVIVGHPHVGQSNDNCAPTLAQLLGEAPSTKQEIFKNHVLRVDGSESHQPLLLHQANQPHFVPLPLEFSSRLSTGQILVGMLVHHVGDQPREIAALHEFLQEIDAEVEIVVAEARRMNSDAVQDGYHVAPLGDRGGHTGVERITGEEAQRLIPLLLVLLPELVDLVHKSCSTANRLLGTGRDVVHIIEMEQHQLSLPGLGDDNGPRKCQPGSEIQSLAHVGHHCWHLHNLSRRLGHNSSASGSQPPLVPLAQVVQS